MQKIFQRSMVLILSISIVVLFTINIFFSVISIRNQKVKEFNRKIDQVYTMIENNQIELDSIKENLNEDYLTRAKAASYVVENIPEVLENTTELNNLADLLAVDELHVIDENGVIIYSTVPRYMGVDFHDGDQTREFLSILESERDDAYVVQEAMPNSAEGKVMKYVGVARKGKKGIVQIGIEPIRQLEAQKRNTYQYIFDRFPTSAEEEYFVIDCKWGALTGHSEGDRLLGSDVRAHIGIDELEACSEGAFKRVKGGTTKLIVTTRYKDELIGISISKSALYQNLWKSVLLTLFCLVFVGFLVTLSLNYLVKKKVVDGIQEILNELAEITNGNLDTNVAVGGNPEFEELSSGINSMVKSIMHSKDRLLKIIAISDVPLAAFEYQQNMQRVFTTPRLKSLLNLTTQEATEIYKNEELFYQKINQILKNPIEGETDIYQTGEHLYVSIHLSAVENGYLGVVTDVTKSVDAKKRMQYENVHDPLTDLFKYQYFKEKARDILRSKTVDEICAVVMLDLDAFKTINDTYGHDMGDEYLRMFASVMKKMPKDHCLTARRSGDEFCMFCFGFLDRTEIQQLLHHFWDMLKESKVKLAPRVEKAIAASGGVAWAELQNQEMDILLRDADEALYQAKRNGKGGFVEYLSTIDVPR